MIRDLLARLAAEAHRHDGSVKIEHARGIAGRTPQHFD